MKDSPVEMVAYDKWINGERVIMGDVDKTLEQRGDRYGAFIGHANVTQELKAVIARHLQQREKVLYDDQQEALDMICHKIGRIINGDPDYADSWHDIAGYASLVDKRLNGEIK